MGVDPRAIVGVRVHDRFSDASIAWWLERSDQAFATGAPLSVENARSRWLRDDGTWGSETFDCVLQPVRDVTGNVNGVLLICTISSSASSSAHEGS
jgi:hypothetical protein